MQPPIIDVSLNKDNRDNFIVLALKHGKNEPHSHTVAPTHPSHSTTVLHRILCLKFECADTRQFLEEITFLKNMTHGTKAPTRAKKYV
jgi:hypothetical protein